MKNRSCIPLCLILLQWLFVSWSASAQQTDYHDAEKAIREFQSAWNAGEWDKVIRFYPENTWQRKPNEVVKTLERQLNIGVHTETQLLTMSTQSMVEIGDTWYVRLTFESTTSLHFNGNTKASIERQYQFQVSKHGEDHVSLNLDENTIAIRKYVTHVAYIQRGQWRVFPANEADLPVVQGAIPEQLLDALRLPREEQLDPRPEPVVFVDLMDPNQKREQILTRAIMGVFRETTEDFAVVNAAIATVDVMHRSWKSGDFETVVNLHPQGLFEIVDKEKLKTFYRFEGVPGVKTKNNHWLWDYDLVTFENRSYVCMNYITEVTWKISDNPMLGIYQLLDVSRNVFGPECVIKGPENQFIKAYKYSTRVVFECESGWCVLPLPDLEWSVAQKCLPEEVIEHFDLPRSEEICPREEANKEEKEPYEQLAEDLVGAMFPHHMDAPTEEESAEFIARLENGLLTKDDFELVDVRNYGGKLVFTAYSKRVSSLAIAAATNALFEPHFLDREIYIFHERDMIPDLDEIADESELQIEALMGAVFRGTDDSLTLRGYIHGLGFIRL